MDDAGMDDAGMDDAAVDGNAIGGLLASVFGKDMTMATSVCGSCGAVSVVAELAVRGPIGGYFVWEAETGGPLLLAAGGSGVVPLRAILRHRSLVGSSVPTRLLYSSRSWEDVIYSSELDMPAYGVEVIHTLTRSQPPKWHGYARRVDRQMLAEVAWPAADRPLAYVCGPTSFVESVAAGLVGLGYPAGRVKTERFGATGQ